MSQTTAGQDGHLDPNGPRDVVYCHQCDNEWYQDGDSLMCPSCEGEITEIVPKNDSASDPRPHAQRLQRPQTPPEIQGLRNHNPWGNNNDDSDPEEADIEEHITHGPNGTIFTHTVRRTAPMTFGNRPGRGQRDEDGQPDPLMRNFQDMLGNLMGPQYRPGQTGRSGPETLFNPPFPPHFGGTTFQYGGEDGQGPRIVGGRFTFTSGGPINREGGMQQGGPDDLATLLGSIFGPGGLAEPRSGEDHHLGGGPPGLAGLFAALVNPANARAGDGVYTQEAFDQILSTLMEQHPTSNAPGPASAEAIASLPKRALDEKTIGPDGKSDCSVCMDDVFVGTEVVFLPCNHWFHETCASAWLSEHNTCPICRKGINDEGAANTAGRGASHGTTPNSRNEHRARRLSTARPSRNLNLTRNAERLDFIRQMSGRSPHDGNSTQITDSGGRQYRIHVVGIDRDFHHRHSTPLPEHTHAPWSSSQPQPSSNNRRPSVLRRNTNNSDRDRNSRRRSQGGNGGSSSGGGGPIAWLRDRFGGGRRSD